MQPGSATTHELAATRWRARPRLAIVVRVVAALVPFLCSIVVTRFALGVLGAPRGWVDVVATFVALGGIGAGTMAAVERTTRRLVPLAALLKLSLVFPDAAPSRYKAALRTGTVAQLERRLAEAHRGDLPEAPAEAAQRLIELVAALSRHDRLTRGHAERVRAYARLIGEELGFDEDKLDLLHWSALLHDVGKLAVPAEILNKPGRLTDDEFEIIKGHPAAGAAMVAPLEGWLGEWALAVLEHHERWDGAGYPAGLAADDISLAGRIVAVADVFDVITSPRSYKPAISADEARREIARCSGTQFDPTVVRAFLNIGIAKLRLLLGPVAWLTHIRLLRDVPLAPVGVAVSGATAGVLAIGGTVAADQGPPPAPAAEVADAATVPGFAAAGDSDDPTTTTVTVVEATTTTTEAGTTTTTATTDPAPPAAGQGGRRPAQPPPPVPQPAPPAPSPPAPTPSTTEPAPTTTTTAPTTTTTAPTTTVPTTTTTATTSTTAAPPPPLVVADDAAATDEDEAVVVPVADNDDPGLGLLAVGPPSAGTATIVGGAVRYTPPPDWSGTATFTYTAGNGTTSGDATVTVTVAPVPDAPVAADDAATLGEDGEITVDVLANDVDVDGDALAVTGIDQPAHGTATIVGGEIRYVPDPDWWGTDVVTYDVEDPSGLGDTAELHLTVTAVDDPPTIVAGEPVVMDWTAAPVALGGWATGISGGPADESQAVEVMVTTSGALVFDGVPEVDAATGDLSFALLPGRSGTAGLTITVDDGTSATTAVTSVTINGVNSLPVAVADVLDIAEDGSGSVDVLANDTDIDVGDQLELVEVDDGDHGTVTWLPGGLVTYVPDPDWSGTEALTYRVHDGAGGVSQGTLTVTVVAVADDPVAAGEAYTSDGATVSVAAPGVLGNDVDVDGDALTVMDPGLRTSAAGAFTLAADGGLTYVPAPSFEGTGTWTYTVGDGTGRTASATVTITVERPPALYLTPAGFAASPLPVVGTEPDHDGDGKPGHTVAKTPGLIGSLLSLLLLPGTQQASWSTPTLAEPLVLDDVVLELWSGIAGLTGHDKQVAVTLWLEDCNSGLGGCQTLANLNRFEIRPWNGGPAGWGRTDVPLGAVDHTVSAGRRLRLTVAFHQEDIWIAMSGDRPSRLHPGAP